MKLNAVLELAKQTDLKGVQFFDVLDMPHILTLRDATKVVVAIGKKYQQDFHKRNELFYKLKHIDKEDIKTVNWHGK